MNQRIEAAKQRVKAESESQDALGFLKAPDAPRLPFPLTRALLRLSELMKVNSDDSSVLPNGNINLFVYTAVEGDISPKELLAFSDLQSSVLKVRYKVFLSYDKSEGGWWVRLKK